MLLRVLAGDPALLRRIQPTVKVSLHPPAARLWRRGLHFLGPPTGFNGDFKNARLQNKTTAVVFSDCCRVALRWAKDSGAMTVFLTARRNEPT